MQYFGHSSLDETISFLLIKPDELKPYVDKSSALRVLGMAQKAQHGEEVFNSQDLIHKFKKSMIVKNINIVDPCFSKNNLGKSISFFNSHRMKECLSM